MAQFFYENKERKLQIHYGNNLTFGAHLHNHIELVGMLKGESGACVDSVACNICEMDAFIVFPNQVHYYEQSGEEYYMLFIFPDHILPELSKIFLNKVPVSPIIPGALMDKRIRQVMENTIELAGEPMNYLQEVELRGNLLVMLSRLFSMMQFADAGKTDSHSLKLILDYCNSHIQEEMKLTDVAARLHLSRHYISHLFSEKLHLTYSDYVRTLKIGRACRLLEEGGLSVTEIADLSGFNSLRSFNRVFDRQMKMSPSEYRKQRLGPV